MTSCLKTTERTSCRCGKDTATRFLVGARSSDITRELIAGTNACTHRQGGGGPSGSDGAPRIYASWCFLMRYR